MTSAELDARVRVCRELLFALCAELQTPTAEHEEDFSIEYGALSACVSVLDMLIGVKIDSDVQTLLEQGLIEAVYDDDGKVKS